MHLCLHRFLGSAKFAMKYTQSRCRSRSPRFCFVIASLSATSVWMPLPHACVLLSYNQATGNKVDVLFVPPAASPWEAIGKAFKTVRKSLTTNGAPLLRGVSCISWGFWGREWEGHGAHAAGHWG